MHIEPPCLDILFYENDIKALNAIKYALESHGFVSRIWELPCYAQDFKGLNYLQELVVLSRNNVFIGLTDECHAANCAIDQRKPEIIFVNRNDGYAFDDPCSWGVEVAIHAIQKDDTRQIICLTDNEPDPIRDAILERCVRDEEFPRDATSQQKLQMAEAKYGARISAIPVIAAAQSVLEYTASCEADNLALPDGKEIVKRQPSPPVNLRRVRRLTCSS